MKWIPATERKKLEKRDYQFIKVGDKIKIYGEETVVKGFYFSYNEGLEKWETIILTTGRGDPLERSLDVIELCEDAYTFESSPTQQQEGDVWMDIDEIKEDQSPYAALLHIKQNYLLIKK